MLTGDVKTMWPGQRQHSNSIVATLRECILFHCIYWIFLGFTASLGASSPNGTCLRASMQAHSWRSCRTAHLQTPELAVALTSARACPPVWQLDPSPRG